MVPGSIPDLLFVLFCFVQFCSVFFFVFVFLFPPSLFSSSCETSLDMQNILNSQICELVMLDTVQACLLESCLVQLIRYLWILDRLCLAAANETAVYFSRLDANAELLN